MAKTSTDAFNDNQIAKGHNNLTGLENIELIPVGGKVAEGYLPRVNDYGQWRDGQVRIIGNRRTIYTGTPSTSWLSPYLSWSQREYIKTSILDGEESNNVTIKTRRYFVPVDSTTLDIYVIANAVLTLPPMPDTQHYIYGMRQFVYQFDNLEIIHEDKMYGEIYVNAGSTSQDNIGTTPELLTAFASDGESNGVTVSNSDDNITVLIAAKYEVTLDLEFTSDAAHKWTFTIYKNGATTSVAASQERNTDPGNICFGRILDLAANDIITCYVNSDDGGSTADITVINGRLSIKSISIV